MATRVDIQKEHFESIKFPKICPVCGSSSPDTTMNMRTYLSVNQPLKEKIGEHWNLNIPVCSKHKKNIIIGRWFSWILFLAMVAVALIFLYFIWVLIGDQNWFVSTVIFVAVIAIGIFIQPKIYTAPFVLESFSYRLLFTFRDDQLAEKFALLNGIDEVHSVMNQARKIKQD